MTSRIRQLLFVLAAAALAATGTPLLAALLGITPGLPKVAFGPPSTTSYAFATGAFNVTALAVDIDLGAPTGKRTITGAKELKISVVVNNSGVLSGPYSATDLTLTGAIDVDGDTVPDYSGLLLSGRAVQFGSQNLAGTVDFYDFRFAPTGGALFDAGLYNGQDLGVSITSEASSFNGLFNRNFGGNAKGSLGAIPLCPGKIGDFVWNDANRNGVQDPGEQGIDGVKVVLKNAANAVIATTTTSIGPFGQHGYYIFEGACGGTYTVEVDVTTLPPGMVASPTLQGGNTTVDSNPNPFTLTLPTDNAQDLTIDFGFNRPCSGRIGDFVWHDANRDGIQDPGENGIVGVTLNLRDPNTDALLATTVTGFNGAYIFENLCAGTYRVELDLTTVPPGFVPSPTVQGGDAALDSNPNPFDVTLPDDFASDLTIDFGFHKPCEGELGDFVWFDTNRNGLQDAGELGIDGVTVRLIDDVTSSVLATTITGPNGFYIFRGLCAGTYRVEVDVTTLPPGYVPTSTLQGSDTAIDSNPNPFTITLPDDFVSDLTIDFGYMAACDARLGDFVWLDVNANGLQDVGEVGIPNVRVNLFDAAHTQIGTMLTAADGFYLFQGLCAGTYTVEVDTSTLPPGLLPSPTLQGGDTAVDSNPNPWTVVLPVFDSEDLTIDFGYRYAPAKLGDFVWEDKNADGTQDAGEPGIAGVTATLLSCDDVVLSTTATNATGFYLFDNLAPGCYKVRFDTPTGFLPTLPNVGDDAADSDAVAGVTGNYTLAAGDANLTVDAGFYKLAKLGDFVWKDLDLDGVQDAGEPGIAGVQVTLLTCGGGVVASMNTNASGLYLFTNLVPGCYKVQFATPAGMTPTLANVGSDAADSDAVGGVTGNYTLASGDVNLTVDAGFFVTPPPCIPATFTLTGNTSVTGTKGNIRTFTTNGISVHASAFSRTDAGAWSSAYLGAYSHGLGVTDTSESGANDTHTVDNMGGRDNYVLFEFSQPVVVTRAYLDYVGVDSDVTVWVGTKTDPYNNHLTLTDALLNTLTKEDNDGPNGESRYAVFTGAAISGNVLVIAASTADSTPDDSFKLKKLDIDCVPPPPPPPTCPTGTFTLTGATSVSGSAGNIRTFTANGVSVKASAFSRTDSTGSWATAYLGAYDGGLGVTDGSESGASNTHKVDNVGGRRNYVLFEFSQPVLVTRAFLDAVSGDSDITVWVGSKVDPYNNHLALSDALLSSLAKEDDDTTSSASRWATFNGAAVTGNVLVIAASKSDTSPDDAFKLRHLEFGCVPVPPCIEGTFAFSGNTAVSGTAGNIRQYSINGVSVKASAFSRSDSTGAWAPAYLGAFSSGLGVTDTSENGANNTHKTDNIGGRDNYVLFEFSKNVVITQAFLDAIGADSDITTWIGTKNDPFTNHLTLSDAMLSSFKKEDDDTTTTTSRWATFNGVALAGNVLVIGASTSDSTPDDSFKIAKVGLTCK